MPLIPIYLAAKARADGDSKALDNFWLARKNFWTTGAQVSQSSFMLEADRWMLRSEFDRLMRARRRQGGCRGLASAVPGPQELSSRSTTQAVQVEA